MSLYIISVLDEKAQCCSSPDVQALQKPCPVELLAAMDALTEVRCKVQYSDWTPETNKRRVTNVIRYVYIEKR